MTISRATTIEELLAQICEKAKDGDYIYRGENKSHRKISSTLYRVYQKEIDAKHFEIDVVEEEVADKVRKHDHDLEKDSNDTILEKLQHYGGKTNQIDFSVNCWVALFFACYGEYEDDGRVILQNKKEVRTHKPTNPKNRVAAQESIFVRSSYGFIEPNEDKVIVVPSEFKKDALEYLSKECDINSAKIYNDIHGYITQAEIHKSAYTHFYRGLTYQSKGEIDEAISAYEEAIKLNPNDVTAYNNRGVAYYDKGNLALALADYTKAIELNPNYAEAYVNRGVVYNDQGEYALAIADYTKAIELNPNYIEAYSNRGNAYGNKGDYDRAFADFKKSIELNPNYAAAYNNRAVVYNDQGEHALALSDCNKAIGLNPSYAEAYYNRGIAKEMNRDYKGAKKDFKTALQLAKKQKNKKLVADTQKEIAKLAELKK